MLNKARKKGVYFVTVSLLCLSAKLNGENQLSDGSAGVGPHYSDDGGNYKRKTTRNRPLLIYYNSA